MDFTSREMFVEGGNTTEAPIFISYSITVSRDRISLELLITSLNDINVISCNLYNTELNSPCW